LLTHEAALWTFVREAGVEPTNNAAEQALRPAVIWRKGCFGAHSADGNRQAPKTRNLADHGHEVAVIGKKKFLEAQSPPQITLFKQPVRNVGSAKCAGEGMLMAFRLFCNRNNSSVVVHSNEPTQQ
jgi:transposase IS66 family protein